ncbi:hypothetical protein EON65_43725 [archaeon]|nr:MAG: hypothetical protein EON65_43725 [archaeon]
MSYVFIYPDTGAQVPGAGYGPTLLNGQAWPSNWYESGSSEGIELVLAKNDTMTYYLWWYIPSMSSFDYSSATSGTMGVSYRGKISGYSYADAVTGSSEYMCYALWTSSAESSCMGNSLDDDDDDDEGDSNKLLGAAVAFSVLTFVAVLVFGLLPYVLKPAAPLAAQAATSSASPPNPNNQL